MEIEEKIAALCLSGLIKNEPAAEREKCIDAIRRVYGTTVARHVQDML